MKAWITTSLDLDPDPLLVVEAEDSTEWELLRRIWIDGVYVASIDSKDQVIELGLNAPGADEE